LPGVLIGLSGLAFPSARHQARPGSPAITPGTSGTSGTSGTGPALVHRVADIGHLDHVPLPLVAARCSCSCAGLAGVLAAGAAGVARAPACCRRWRPRRRASPRTRCQAPRWPRCVPGAVCARRAGRDQEWRLWCACRVLPFGTCSGPVREPVPGHAARLGRTRPCPGPALAACKTRDGQSHHCVKVRIGWPGLVPWSLG
jgi:hypothetical protein